MLNKRCFGIDQNATYLCLNKLCTEIMRCQGASDSILPLSLEFPFALSLPSSILFFFSLMLGYFNQRQRNDVRLKTLFHLLKFNLCHVDPFNFLFLPLETNPTDCKCMWVTVNEGVAYVLCGEASNHHYCFWCEIIKYQIVSVFSLTLFALCSLNWAHSQIKWEKAFHR